MAPDVKHGPLPGLFMILTAVSGVVDAISYLRLGHTFVANMTGNIIFLGFAAAGASGVSLSASLVALSAFLLGSLLGGRLGVRFGDHRGRLLAASIGFKVAFVAVALVVALAGVAGEVGRDLIAGLLALTMGTQSAVTRRIAVPDLTTTVLTGTLTSLVAESRLAGGHGTNTGRRLSSVVVMLGGAAAGTFAVLHFGIAAGLIITLTLFAITGVLVLRLSAGEPAWARAA